MSNKLKLIVISLILCMASCLDLSTKTLCQDDSDCIAGYTCSDHGICEQKPRDDNPAETAGPSDSESAEPEDDTDTGSVSDTEIPTDDPPVDTVTDTVTASETSPAIDCTGILKFEDSTLKSSICTAVQKSDVEEITAEDVADLTQLSIGGSEIESLAGIECLQSLTWLDLVASKVSDLGPLSSLNLEELYLSANAIESLAPLQKMKLLRVLEAASCEITDIAPLAGLENLTNLNLANNPKIDDFSHLAGMKSLSVLYLSNCAVSDTALSNIKQLTDLKDLSVAYGSLTNITPLGQLTQLQTLILDGNFDLVDISILESLERLNWVHLSSTSLTDLSPLARNAQFGEGAVLKAKNTKIDCADQNDSLKTLKERGVKLECSCPICPN